MDGRKRQRSPPAHPSILAYKPLGRNPARSAAVPAPTRAGRPGCNLRKLEGIAGALKRWDQRSTLAAAGKLALRQASPTKSNPVLDPISHHPDPVVVDHHRERGPADIPAHAVTAVHSRRSRHSHGRDCETSAYSHGARHNRTATRTSPMPINEAVAYSGLRQFLEPFPVRCRSVDIAGIALAIRRLCRYAGDYKQSGCRDVDHALRYRYVNCRVRSIDDQ